MEFNLVAIIIATIVNMVLGAVWYSPVLFSKPWVKLSGVSMDKMSKTAGQRGYLVSFIGSLVTAIILDYLITLTGLVDLSQGIRIGFVAGLGFLAATMISDYMFAGRPMKLYYINLGYRWLGLVLMGAVIGILG